VPLPPDLPVVDHHCHLSPSGDGVRAVERFRAAGGTHLFLATQNYTGIVPRTIGDYTAQFETTFRLADRVREETGAVVYPVVAPYPIDLVAGSEAIGLAAALQLQRDALDLAGRAIRERRAVALGEVGWAHFPVAGDVAAAIEAAFRHALEVAHEVGCPAVVHSADLDAAGYRQLAARAVEANLVPGRVVKHYARARELDTAGIVPSYLARRELVQSVVTDPAPWFLETDFLDDPARPGAVLDLATVPRRAQAIAGRGPEWVERLRGPFVESVERVYGVRPEVAPGGPK
jgi:TatD-related deoxyribonuclease